MSYYNEDFLAHHGTKGQKWGIRRYQNLDGSLTEEGRRRRGYSLKPKSKGNKENSVKALVGRAKQLKAAKAESKKAEDEARKAQKEADDYKKRMDHFRYHPEDMYKHRKELSPDEVNKIMENVQFDRKLADIRREEVKRGFEKVSDFSGKVKKVNDLYTTGKALYNNVAEVNNTLIDFGIVKDGKRMPKIGEKKNDDAFDALVKKGKWDEIYENRDNYSTEQINRAQKRAMTEDLLKKWTSHKDDSKPKEQTPKQQDTAEDKAKEKRRADMKIATTGSMEEILNNINDMEPAVQDVAINRYNKLREQQR